MSFALYITLQENGNYSVLTQLMLVFSSGSTSYTHILDNWFCCTFLINITFYR